MKIKNFLSWQTVAVAVGMAVTSAFAVDSAILNSVPADRQVVIVVNAPAVLESAPFHALEKAGVLPNLDTQLAELEQATGFDPRRDLERLVIAKFDGPKPEELVLLEGAYDQSRLENLLLFNPKYSKSEHNSVTIHSWFDEKEGKQKFGAFLTDHLIVIGPEKGVQQVIDARGDHSLSFGARTEVQRVLAGLTREPVLWGVGRDVGQPPMKKLPVVLLTIDLDPQFTVNLTAETVDAGAAQNVRVLVGGIIALGRLMENKPDAKLLADSASVGGEKNTVELTITMPDEKFTPWLIQAVKAKHQGS